MNGLVKRGQVYYFRVRIPCDLLNVFDGRKEIWKTLNTQSEQDAHNQCLVLAERTRKFFDILEAGMLSQTQMRRLVSGFVREGLSMMESWRFSTTNDEEIAAWNNLNPNTLEVMERELREDIAASRFSRIIPILDTLLAKITLFQIDKDSEDYRNLTRHLAIAMLQLLETEQERKRGNYLNAFDKSRYDLLPSQQNTKILPSEKVQASSPLISEVIVSYVDEKITGERWDIKTKQQNESALALMVEILGDQPVSNITHQHMLGVRDTLKRLPPNRSKFYPDKSIEAVLRLKNIKPMSIITINNILTRMSSFWHWAEIHEYVERSPSRNLSMPTSKRADEERSIYTVKEIQLLLDAVAEKSRPASHPERVWITLIAMHSGMRPNEIAQLYLDDVVTENGVLCFRVNDTHNDQKVKNKRARRLVPVHPLLLEFGFERYVKAVSHNRTHRLFAKLRHHRDGYLAYFGRWMQDLNREVVTKDKTKTFYSLRHNFITAMKNAQVDFTLIAELVGHTVPGETLGRYGKAMNPKVLSSALSQLKYEVDFTKIRVAAKQTYA